MTKRFVSWQLVSTLFSCSVKLYDKHDGWHRPKNLEAVENQLKTEKGVTIAVWVKLHHPAHPPNHSMYLMIKSSSNQSTTWSNFLNQITGPESEYVKMARLCHNLLESHQMNRSSHQIDKLFNRFASTSLKLLPAKLFLLIPSQWLFRQFSIE